MWSTVLNMALKYLEAHPEVLENLVTLLFDQLSAAIAKAAAEKKAGAQS